MNPEARSRAGDQEPAGASASEAGAGLPSATATVTRPRSLGHGRSGTVLGHGMAACLAPLPRKTEGDKARRRCAATPLHD